MAVLGVLAGAAVLTAVLGAPWYGLGLTASGVAYHDTAYTRIGAIRSSGKAWIEVVAEDLTEEPDGLAGGYPAMAKFFERQSALEAVLDGRPVELQTAGRGLQRFVAHQRGLAELPATFWVQVVTGIGGLIIGGWVWAIRPGDLAARMFAISGFGLMVSALCAAVYSTRELALDGALFARLSDLNHLGAQVFAAAMIGLFLCYPRHLVKARWLWLAPALIAPLYGASLLRIAPGPNYDLYLPIVLETLAILVLIVIQWRQTGRDPQGRAALTWLGVSVMLGCGAFVVTAAAPALLQAPRPPQGYAFGVFLVIYAGLALGLKRYRLFEAGEWAYRVLFFSLGAVLLLILDAALIMALHWTEVPALGVSLMLVGFAYLPLRDLIWRRLAAKRRLEAHELFAAALEVAFADPARRAERWRVLLSRLFDPLQIEALDVAVPAPALRDNGLVLLLPAVAEAPPLRLAYPGGGRSLFSPEQLTLATHLVSLTRQAESSRAAHERGAAEERSRMAQDLHDDVGARLLSGLHAADAATRPVLHAALSDIRSIVSGLTGERAPLERVLADARHEAGRRLEAAGIALDWPLPDLRQPGLPLDYRRHKALASALRETVSNVIRHAGATRLTVTVTEQGDTLVLTVADDGAGLPQDAIAGQTGGHGMRSLRQRMQDIGGALTLSNTAQGACVRMDIPLDPPKQGALGLAPALSLP